MDKLPQEAEILLYSTGDGAIKIDVLAQDDTLWLTQKRMSELFQVDRTVVTKHLKNIFNDKELDKNSVCAKFAHVGSTGQK